jgi:hypothetical protein
MGNFFYEFVVQNASSHPSLVEDPGNTSDTYEAHDRYDSRFNILGSIRSVGGERVLSFIVVAELPGGLRGSLRGSDFFDAMMTHFGNNVDVIQAEWSDNDPKLKSNLDAFNAATAAGDTLEVAVTKTPTGKYALRKAFTKIQIDRALPIGANGRYNDLSVFFRR